MAETTTTSEPVVSIIVPVYNSARYIHTSIDSILAQTYTNLEIILVDDGSTDDSPAICDQYAAQDARVHVIHQTNQGEGGARNTGLDAATGDYVMWVDSDDWIDSTWVQYFIDALQVSDADVIITGDGVGTYQHPEALRQFLLNRIVHTMWTSCTKRSVYKGLSFGDHTIGTDVLMQIQVLFKAQSVRVIPRSNGYHYIDNDQSVTRTSSIRTRLGWPKRAEFELDFVRSKAPQMLNCARFDVMRGAAVIYENVKKLNVPADEKQEKRALQSRLRSYVFSGIAHLPLKYMRKNEYLTVLKSIRKLLF